MSFSENVADIEQRTGLVLTNEFGELNSAGRALLDGDVEIRYRPDGTAFLEPIAGN